MAKIYVALALDVEEEGLFTGKYDCHNPSMTNLAYLFRLMEFINLGLKPTLFCAYPVLADPTCQKIVRDFCQVSEVGLHLHHWNTPPLENPENPVMTSVPAYNLPLPLFAAKLKNLCEIAAHIFDQPIRSFRMGRWDLHRSMFPLLAECGITCDASVRPLHWHRDGGNGPDHFDAPADPYWIHTPTGDLLEVPLTVIPLIPSLATLPPRWFSRLHNVAALALLPVYHPLWLLKFVTIQHIQRGGQVLSLTWHSSEMMPGATPQLPDKNSVDKFIAKMKSYFHWVEASFDVQYVTMHDLTKLEGFSSPMPAPGDWLYGEAYAAC